jgi:hypothetical protein
MLHEFRRLSGSMADLRSDTPCDMLGPSTRAKRPIDTRGWKWVSTRAHLDLLPSA